MDIGETRIGYYLKAELLVIAISAWKRQGAHTNDRVGLLFGAAALFAFLLVWHCDGML